MPGLLPGPQRTESPDPVDVHDLAPRARAYVAAALARRDEGALQVVRDALAAGTSASDLLLGVLRPAQVEVARRCAAGELTRDDEQFVVGLTERSLRLLTPALPRQRGATGPHVVSVAVADEIRVQLVATALQLAGWHGTHLGPDVPPDHVAGYVATAHPDVLVLSATDDSHVQRVRETIEAVRAAPRCAPVRVLACGRPFELDPGLAERIGADAWARGPHHALRTCEGWLVA